MKPLILRLIALLCLTTILVNAQAFDHTHSAFTAVLKAHVKGQQVDYAAMKKDPKPLANYLDSLAAISEGTFRAWQREQQMAFLINLYNAATLKLIIDHYPVKSIQEISKSKGGPWKQNIVRLFAKAQTLDHIEHNLLRPKYRDPRIHFAVNCASIGCPALRAEAFSATNLSTQMEEQARAFLADTKKNRLDAKNKTLHLSQLFDWFKDDFAKKSSTVEAFIAPYFPAKDRALIQAGKIKLQYANYDWNLNGL